jgi:cell division protein FtsW
MVLSASSVKEMVEGRSPWTVFVRHLMWAGLGVVSLMIVARIPYERWRRWVTPLLGLSLVGMTLPFMPGIGIAVNGAHAWVRLPGGFTFQPSEFLKLAVLMYCADMLARREKQMHVTRATLGPCLVVVGLAAGAMLAQNDLGSAIVVCAIVLTVAFIAGTPITPLSMTAGAFGLVGMLFVLSTPYRRERWLAFRNIAKYKSEKEGFQVWEGLVATASGQWNGVGIGASHQKFRLPLAHSDFVFSILAEELGLIGVIAVLGAFGLIAFFGVQIALGCDNRYGMLLAGGVAAWIGVQAVINMGGVTSIMPLTGLTLPFMSAGGSSLFVTMSAVGLLLNISRPRR